MSEGPHFEKVKSILTDSMDVDPIMVIPEARLGMDLGLDSMDREEFTMIIEDEFDIKIRSSDIQTLSKPDTRVQDVLNYLDEKITA